MTEIRIYCEGDKKLRRGFSEFLKEVRDKARRNRLGFQCIPCGAEPVRDFCIALRSHSEAFNVLLLDQDGHLSFEGLQKRNDWRPPREVSEDRVHWMVQVMESWFLADRDALRAYYKRRLHESALPPERRDVEEIPKRDVIDGLKRATDGGYHKTAHAPAILERLNPEKVRERAPNCNRLFDTLLARLAD